jgi:hypothetical protein
VFYVFEFDVVVVVDRVVVEYIQQLGAGWGWGVLVILFVEMFASFFLSTQVQIRYKSRTQRKEQ